MGAQDLKRLVTAALGQGLPQVAVVSKGPAVDQLTKDLLSNISLCTPGKTPSTSAPGKVWCAGWQAYHFETVQSCPQYHNLIMYYLLLLDGGNSQVEPSPSLSTL